MPTPKSTIFAFCFCLLMTFCAVSAKADTTYTYTGKTFSVGECFPPLIGGCSLDSIDGSLTLASPLGDNLKDVVVNPKSYSFETDGFTDTNLNIALPPMFTFSTNASGQIDGWNVNVSSVFCCYAGEYDIAISSSFVSPFDSDDFLSTASFPSLFPFPSFAVNVSVPGTWTVSTTGTNVPEPGSGALLIAGLVGLAALALKKSL